MTEESCPGRRYASWLAAILLFGLIVRLARLGEISLWADEGFELWMIGHPFAGMMQVLAAYDAHPPLFEILVHPLAGLLTSEVSVRLPSVVFGVGTIYVVFLLARELFDSRVGLLAAFLTAVSNYHVTMAMDLRMYSLFCLLSTISMYWFVRLMKGGGRRDFVYYGISTFLLLMTHYFSVFVVGAQNLYWLLHAREKGTKAWLALQGALGLSASAVYITLLSSLRPGFGPPYLEGPPSAWVLVRLVSSFFAGVSHPAFDPVVDGLLAAGLVIPLAWAVRGGWAREDSLQWALPLYALVTPFLVLYALTYLTLRHVVSLKYVIFLYPFVLAWLSAGVLLRAGGLRRIACALVLVVFLATNGYSMYCHYFVEAAQKQNWKGVARYIRERVQPGDLVMIQNGFQKYVADFYLGDAAPRFYPLPEMVPEPVEQVTAPYRRVWYVNAYGFQVDPGLKVALYLDKRLRVADVRTFPNFDPGATITVVLYVRQAVGGDTRAGVSWGEGAPGGRADASRTDARGSRGAGRDGGRRGSKGCPGRGMVTGEGV